MTIVNKKHTPIGNANTVVSINVLSFISHLLSYTFWTCVVGPVVYKSSA